MSRENLLKEVVDRLRKEGRWQEAMPVRDRLMREARDLGLSKVDAQETAYTQLAAMFPPMSEAEIAAAKAAKAAAEAMSQQPKGQQTGQQKGQQQVGGVEFSEGDDATTMLGTRARAREGESAVVGLNVIPEDWPPLPPNATLAVEVQWVLANRLQCIEEHGDQVVVDLSRALTPAPSYAALGWLETSIRAFTKFCDISAKVANGTQDEQDRVRRERLSIEEIRGLLAEMRSQASPK